MDAKLTARFNLENSQMNTSENVPVFTASDVTLALDYLLATAPRKPIKHVAYYTETYAGVSIRVRLTVKGLYYARIIMDDKPTSFRGFKYAIDALTCARAFIDGNMDAIPYDVRRKARLI